MSSNRETASSHLSLMAAALVACRARPTAGRDMIILGTRQLPARARSTIFLPSYRQPATGVKSGGFSSSPAEAAARYVQRRRTVIAPSSIEPQPVQAFEYSDHRLGGTLQSVSSIGGCTRRCCREEPVEEGGARAPEVQIAGGDGANRT
jgi:hypothetical protein